MSRYAKNWSARIALLKNALDSEGLEQSDVSSTELARQREEKESVAEREEPNFALEDMKKLEERHASLAQDYKRFQEAALHEIHLVNARLDELKEFIKAKDIEVQNLKSDLVAAKLVEKEHFEKLERQTKITVSDNDKLQENILELTELINGLKKKIVSADPAGRTSGIIQKPLPPLDVPPIIQAPAKPLLSRWIQWWQEPVTSIAIPKRKSE